LADILPPAPGDDFTVLLERSVLAKKQFIILNSPSDTAIPINALQEFIDKYIQIMSNHTKGTYF